MQCHCFSAPLLVSIVISDDSVDKWPGWQMMLMLKVKDGVRLDLSEAADAESP